MRAWPVLMLAALPSLASAFLAPGSRSISGRSAAKTAVGSQHHRRRTAPLVAVAARDGDVVTADLQVLLEDGTPMPGMFDQGRVRFRLGHGWMAPYVHEAARGMAARESKALRVGPDEAYGPYHSELTAEIPMDNAPAGLKVGDKVKLSNGMNARVAKIDQAKQTVTIDANRPFAGRTLTVKLSIEAIESLESGRFEVVQLAAGCFWGLELAFQRTRGVVGSAVGYTQGQKGYPSYSEVCAGTTGHAEAVEVIYDPKEVSFEQILHVFWGRHDPTQLNRQGNDVGTQYRSGIYYTSEAQRQIAEASMAALAASGKYEEPIVTELLPATMFWRAEDYHQQYLEKGGQSAKKNDPATIRCYG